MEFPEVPVKVTLNEYIEIAKDYCTAKSSTFVNGILDKIVKEMRARGSFTKAGRGLIGENTGHGATSKENGGGSRRKRDGSLKNEEAGIIQDTAAESATESDKQVKKRKRQ